jgi:formate C-acetyltransferase
MTESYKITEGESTAIRRAKAMHYIFSNIPIWISPFQLIIGSPTGEIYGAEVENEFCISWMEEEIEINGVKMTELEAIPIRDVQSFILEKEDKRIILEEIIPYWKGKDLDSIVNNEVKRNYPDKYFVWKYFDVASPLTAVGPSHTVQDYASVLKKGLKGIKSEIQHNIDTLNLSNSFNINEFDRKNYYEGMLICIDGLILYAHRCADFVEKLAQNETNKKRKKELLEISRVCKKVPENPAESWWEALQMWHFLHMGTYLAEGGSSHATGRFDQYMYPYLKKDLDQAKITRKHAQELLECLFIEFSRRLVLSTHGAARSHGGFRINDQMTIGGMDSYGRDCTNELSCMLLEAHAHVHLNEPNLSVRVHKYTPDSFLKQSLEVVRLGGGLPIIVNDEVIIPAFLAFGVNLKEARNFADEGCESNMMDPNMSDGADSYGHNNAGWFNLPKCIELTLFNGINPQNGEQVGPRTGDPRNFKSMREFINALKFQIEFAVEVNVVINNIIECCFVKYFPSLYHGFMHPGPRSKGIDYCAGACKYNWTGAFGIGLATAGDSLSAINDLIYEKKETTWEELLIALENNWEGYEILRQKCIQAPKFGEDDERADKLACEVSNIFFDAYEKHPTSRGGKFVCGTSSMGQYITKGEKTGATPDGRKKADPLSDGMSPSIYAKLYGPTATHNSVAKIDTFRLLNGVAFNQRFNKSSLLSERVLNKLIALIKTYFQRGGQEIQYSVVDPDELKEAQKYPERYKDLIIRVGGFSAAFVDLDKKAQESFIKRAEQTI